MSKLVQQLRRYFPQGAEVEIWEEFRPDLVHIQGAASQRVTTLDLAEACAALPIHHAEPVTKLVLQAASLLDH
jgi:hypothetical protein